MNSQVKHEIALCMGKIPKNRGRLTGRGRVAIASRSPFAVVHLFAGSSGAA